MDTSGSNELLSSEVAEQERLGKKLREAREYLGLSQEVVADHLGIPRASISAIETGKRKVSSLELKRFAQLYKQPVDALLGGESATEQSDDTTRALFRAAGSLSAEDKQQVLRFAQFLRSAGRAPSLSAANDERDDADTPRQAEGV